MSNVECSVLNEGFGLPHHSTFNIEHSTLNIEHFGLGPARPAALVAQGSATIFVFIVLPRRLPGE
jgi:hypothetical protein